MKNEQTNQILSLREVVVAIYSEYNEAVKTADYTKVAELAVRFNLHEFDNAPEDAGLIIPSARLDFVFSAKTPHLIIDITVVDRKFSKIKFEIGVYGNLYSTNAAGYQDIEDYLNKVLDHKDEVIDIDEFF